MDFKGSKPIFLQIVDFMIQNIVSGNWKVDERIPSVRDFAVSVEVNPNTVVRSFNYLQDKGIIYNKRGVGYFVSEKAAEVINDYRKDEFIKNELPEMFKLMDLLNISMNELKAFYKNYKSQREKNSNG